MSRFVPAALFLLLAPAVGFAAPVPKVVLTAEQEQEFNDLWDGVGRRQSDSIRQFCRLVSQPDAAVAYITKTVKPAKLDEKEAKQLIIDLNSKDAATWRAAARDLRNRDVRLAMTFTEAWELAKTDEHKLRLGLTMYACSAVGADPDEMTFELTIPRGKEEKGEVSCKFAKGLRTGWNQELFDTFDDADVHRTVWQYSDGDALITAQALERIGTPAARKLLESLAQGHQYAPITIEATAALERLKKSEKVPNVELDTAWRRLELTDFIDLDMPTAFLERPKGVNTSTPTAFLNQPKEAVAFFKKTLVPVKLTKDGAEKLLAKLLSDDQKEVHAALRELRLVDLALELDLEEQFKQLKTAEHRCRLAGAMYLWRDVHGDDLDGYDIDEQMKTSDYFLDTSRTPGRFRAILWWARRGESLDVARRNLLNFNRPETLCRTKDDIDRDRWYREESAIYILDAIGTDDAIAIIKDMATGHPDAGPTKAAKDVLKRRGLK